MKTCYFPFGKGLLMASTNSRENYSISFLTEMNRKLYGLLLSCQTVMTISSWCILQKDKVSCLCPNIWQHSVMFPWLPSCSGGSPWEGAEVKLLVLITVTAWFQTLHQRQHTAWNVISSHINDDLFDAQMVQHFFLGWVTNYDAWHITKFAPNIPH